MSVVCINRMLPMAFYAVVFVHFKAIEFWLIHLIFVWDTFAWCWLNIFGAKWFSKGKGVPLVITEGLCVIQLLFVNIWLFTYNQ